jgi:hypothetical protein
MKREAFYGLHALNVAMLLATLTTFGCEYGSDRFELRTFYENMGSIYADIGRTVESGVGKLEERVRPLMDYL